MLQSDPNIESSTAEAANTGLMEENDDDNDNHMDHHTELLTETIDNNTGGVNKLVTTAEAMMLNEELNKVLNGPRTGKGFQCSQCDKTFKKPSGLKQHFQTHTGMLAL